MKMRDEAYKRLAEHGVRPSVQRMAIMEFLLENPIHPTVDDVYQGLCHEIPTLSKTTVYSTLRLFSEHNAAQMLTIDDHRVCYDGNTEPHVHFFCKRCGKVYDLFDETAPRVKGMKVVDGNIVEEEQLYYRGICKECAAKEEKIKN
jgi:Fur family peroxide stress response transcriptional regulator